MNNPYQRPRLKYHPLVTLVLLAVIHMSIKSVSGLFHYEIGWETCSITNQTYITRVPKQSYLSTIVYPGSYSFYRSSNQWTSESDKTWWSKCMYILQWIQMKCDCIENLNKKSKYCLFLSNVPWCILSFVSWLNYEVYVWWRKKIVETWHVFFCCSRYQWRITSFTFFFSPLIQLLSFLLQLKTFNKKDDHVCVSFIWSFPFFLLILAGKRLVILDMIDGRFPIDYPDFSHVVSIFLQSFSSQTLQTIVNIVHN